MTQIRTATAWTDNAEMIADVARLGHIPRTAHVFDPTFGKGVWWKTYRPRRLYTNDIDPDSEAEFHEDFTQTSWDSQCFDVVAFDPPYVAPGGRKTSTIEEFNKRYGIGKAPATPALLQLLINDGMIEMRRLLVPKGRLLVKCTDYVSGGKMFDGEKQTYNFAKALGFRYLDRFLLLGEPGAQPAKNLDGSRRRQVHTRSNVSTLFVFQRP